jgi:catechol-2,3-dioxygenase
VTGWPNVHNVTQNRASTSVAPITGLAHVQLLASDVSASATWYRTALGLEVYAEDTDNGYVALRHRGARLVVVLTAGPDTEPRRAATDQGGHEHLDHLAFAVPDGDALRAWADHLSTIGVDHGGITLENGNPSLQLRDPDGIAIELVAPGAPSRHGPDAETTPIGQHT